jgi:hypothetical protein
MVLLAVREDVLDVVFVDGVLPVVFADGVLPVVFADVSAVARAPVSVAGAGFTVSDLSWAVVSALSLRDMQPPVSTTKINARCFT